MRLIDADAYAAEMKKRQDACMEAMENASYDGEQFSPKEHWDGVLAAFAEAKLMLDDMQTVGGWISVKDSLPEEHESIFHKLLGTPKWSSAMWQQESDKVLVCVSFPDGTSVVTTGCLHNSDWVTTVSKALPQKVTHWMPLPEPPKEVSSCDKP